jgi:hypothetical protein
MSTLAEQVALALADYNKYCPDFLTAAEGKIKRFEEAKGRRPASLAEIKEFWRSEGWEC